MRPPPSVCSFTSAGTSTNKRTNEHWSAQRRQLDAGASSNYFAELPLLTLVRVQTLAVVRSPKTLRAFIAPSPSPSLCFSFSFLFSLLLLPQVCTYVCVCVVCVSFRYEFNKWDLQGKLCPFAGRAKRAAAAPGTLVSLLLTDLPLLPTSNTNANANVTPLSNRSSILTDRLSSYLFVCLFGQLASNRVDQEGDTDDRAFPGSVKMIMSTGNFLNFLKFCIINFFTIKEWTKMSLNRVPDDVWVWYQSRAGASLNFIEKDWSVKTLKMAASLSAPTCLMMMTTMMIVVVMVNA